MKSVRSTLSAIQLKTALDKIDIKKNCFIIKRSKFDTLIVCIKSTKQIGHKLAKHAASQAQRFIIVEQFIEEWMLFN